MRIKITKILQDKVFKDFGIFLEKGSYNILEDNFRVETPASVKGVAVPASLPFFLGAFSHINHGGLIQNCTIGRYCAIGTNVKIGNGEHPTNWLSINSCQFVEKFHSYDKILKNKITIKEWQAYKHTYIGNDVWIGANVFIKDGVTIGDGAIIGACTVVTKDVPPYAIVVGNPGKIIRYRFSQEIIDELLKLKWWEYDISEFGEVDFDNIEKAISQLRIILPNLSMYKPKVLDLDYFARNIPIKVKFGGLLRIYAINDYKEVYLAGKRISKNKIKK